MKKILWGLLVLLALDAAVFRSGWYSSFLSSDSIQGRSQRIIVELEEMPPTPTANILLLGDSHLTEGFNAGVASARVVEHGLRFLPGGSPGTGIRDWCYFLEEVDPDSNRYRAVVLTFASFRRRAPDSRDFDNVARDADVLAPVVSTPALVNLIGNAPHFGEQLSLAPRVLFSALNYRRDLLDLVQHPERRWLDYKGKGATFGLPMYGGYAGHPESVVGLAWHPESRTLAVPDQMAIEDRREIERDVQGANADLSPAADAYTAAWVERIARRYESGPSRLVLVRLPSSPVPAAFDESSLPMAAFVDQLRGRKNVIVAPENAFTNLERPENFFDGRHLNADGRRELTRQMTNLLVGMLEDGRIRPH